MRANLNDELKHYLKDVAKSKVLTRDEEISLFKRLAKGDETAREEIVEANLRFVIKIALSYSGRGVAIADLIQEGNIGLLDVVGKFDYKRGYRFSTYAAFWIKQAIQLALRKQCNVIRLPIRKSRFLGYVNEAINNFTQAHGRAPSNRELAVVVDMDEDKLEHLMQLRDSVLSLDVEGDDESVQMLNKLQDESTPSPLEHCLDAEKRQHVARVLDTLTEKEQKVIKLRYGFGNGRNLSLRSTSKVVGMSQEGVRRVERKALKKLRRPATRAMVGGLL
ncbi:MAG: sigma-70 family RNA polymerase sigma factor [Candidatus Sumerlaeaceae bacterium]|nr:sigma-70 family RNA polymerase sigma factor [Candidatus Sumerlaeaceae bacterium]